MKKNPVKNSPRMLEVFELIARERVRQRELLAAGRFKHCCDSREISNFQKLAIATEELGEVAREIFEMHDKNDFSPERKAALRAELVQLAAVTVAWLETGEPPAATISSTARSIKGSA